MKTSPKNRRSRVAGFTLVEILISLSILVTVMSLAMGSYLMGLRAMYKDTQRLITNASLRSFLAQISKETLDASTFYLFRYYTSLDSSVNPDTEIVIPSGPEIDPTGTDYDKWITHGDCLVLVTKTTTSNPVKIRQIRIYFRVTTDQTSVNAEAPLRYYESADWGEDGTPSGYTNTHLFSNLATEIGAINLNGNPNRSGTRLLNARCKGRKVAAPYTGYSAGDLYPIFSTESPSVNPSNGYVSINVEFINGSTVNNLLSSSSFNYTISPRR